MLLLPSAWTYEVGLPTEVWIPGFWADAVLVISGTGTYSLFLHTPVWVKGISFSCRVLYKNLRQHRQVRGAGLWIEVRDRAYRPGLWGPRGVSTPLYHKLGVQISRLCRVHFHTCICCLMHHVHYCILCERFGLKG